PGSPQIIEICRRIEQRTQHLLRRRSVREQRLPVDRDCQTIIWLDGEALCVTPRCRKMFNTEHLLPLGYGDVTDGSRQTDCQIILPDGSVGRLTRRRTNRFFSRWKNVLRGRRWTSPEVHHAASLLREERLGAAPKLLAFGQCFRRHGIVESFLLT